MEVYKLNLTSHSNEAITQEIKKVLPAELNTGDIIVHKGIRFYVLVSFLKVTHPNIEAQPIMPGTEPYTQVGEDSSYISKKF